MVAQRTPRRRASRKATVTPVNRYAQFTDRVIGALTVAMEGDDDHLAPWQRPYSVAGLHRNPLGKVYRGINQLMLMIAAFSRGYDDNRWLTFKQASEAAGKAAKAAGCKVEKNTRGFWVYADGNDKGKSCGGVRKGQNAAAGCGSTEVVFWGKVESKDEKAKGKAKRKGKDKEKTRLVRFMRTYSVFNVEQLDDRTREHLGAPAREHDHDPIEAAETIVVGYKISTHHGGDRAFYSPLTDRIQLPKRERFHTPAAYYSTRFHEMGHSTGAEKRLNRPGIADFDYKGSHQYADEELVAEITACILAGEAGIERVVENNSVAYLKHWADRLKADSRLIVMAAMRAQTAADLILGRTFEEKEEAA